MEGNLDWVVEEKHPDGVEGMDRFSDVVEMAGQEYLVLDGLHVGLRGEENHILCCEDGCSVLILTACIQITSEEGCEVATELVNVATDMLLQFHN